MYRLIDGIQLINHFAGISIPRLKTVAGYCSDLRCLIELGDVDDVRISKQASLVFRVTEMITYGARPGKSVPK